MAILFSFVFGIAVGIVFYGVVHIGAERAYRMDMRCYDCAHCGVIDENKITWCSKCDCETNIDNNVCDCFERE